MADRARPRAGAWLPLLLLLALGADVAAQASIAEANAKLLAKAAKKVSSAEAKVAKKQAAQAKKEAALAAREAALAADEATLALLQELLELAQQDLAQALEMPEGTIEEQIAKGDAVAIASKGVALALGEVGKYAKKVAKHEAVIAKLVGSIDALAALVPLLQDVVASVQAQHDLLLVPFDHRTTASWPLHVGVTDGGGQPVPRARVMVLDALRPKGKKKLETLTSAEVWWQGFTDAQGQVAAEVSLPAALKEVDVVVHRAGHVGPWSEPALRDAAGPFAPSSRLHVACDELAELLVTLTEAP